MTLRLLREKALLSQVELARKVGVTKQSLNDWEHGKAKPSSSARRKLVEVFNCSADELLAAIEGRQVEEESPKPGTLRQRLMNLPPGVFSSAPGHEYDALRAVTEITLDFMEYLDAQLGQVARRVDTLARAPRLRPSWWQVQAFYNRGDGYVDYEGAYHATPEMQPVEFLVQAAYRADATRVGLELAQNYALGHGPLRYISVDPIDERGSEA